MLRWTISAMKDLNSVLQRIATDDPEAAQRVALSIRAASARLDQFPQMGRNGTVMGTRELVIPGLPFILVYRQKNPDIHILRILHTRQQWPESD